jgi:hypothetical protein
MHSILSRRNRTIVLLLLLLTTSAGAQQTLYVPNGASGIGISSNGNVGIGTAAPSKPLVVEGSGSSNHQQALFTPDGSNGLFLVGSSQSTHYNWLIGEQYNISAALEFTPSTSVGGASFTTPVVVIQQNGNVGIGTTAPTIRAEITSTGAGVQRTLALTNEQNAPDVGSTLEFRNSVYGGITWLGGSIQGVRNGASAGHSIVFNTKRGGQSGETVTEAMRISEGNVGIGTTNPTQKLSVNGTIRAKEVIVDTGWSDYVFAPGYRLAPLSEVEQHIKADGHLPGIPSAAQVAEHGVTVGEMQAKLLAKIEELTLHQIEQEKAIVELKSENAALRSQNEQIICRLKQEDR